MGSQSTLTTNIYDLHAAAVRTGAVTILDVFDAHPWFTRLPGDSPAPAPAESWLPWRAFLAAAYGLPMSEREYDFFRKHTGRKDPPKKRVGTICGVMGRRARKTAIMALIAVYEAAFRDYSPYLAPGERALFPMVAREQGDAKQLFNFTRQILLSGLQHVIPAATKVRLGSGWEESDRADKILPPGETIALAGVDLHIRHATIRTARSRSVIGLLADEVAYWKIEGSSDPDREVIASVSGSQANIPEHLRFQVLMSSPYFEKGVLFETFDRYYGVETDEALVWQAKSYEMNDTPAIHSWAAKRLKADPVVAYADIGLGFRKDTEDYVTERAIRAVMDMGVDQRRPQPNLRYVACVDPTGGSNDSYTLSIAHWAPGETPLSPGVVIHDAVYEWSAPLAPDQVTEVICDVLRGYRVKQVWGDRYAGEWPPGAFRAGAHRDDCSSRRPDRKPEDRACTCKDVWQVTYMHLPLTRSELYVEFIPILNAASGRVRLLENPRMLEQFKDLRRRALPGGREIIDHRPGRHDDVANVVAGSVVMAARQKLAPEVRAEPQTLEEVRNQKLHRRLNARQSPQGNPWGSL